VARVVDAKRDELLARGRHIFGDEGSERRRRLNAARMEDDAACMAVSCGRARAASLSSELLRNHLLNPLIQVGVLGDKLSEDVVLLDSQPFLLNRFFHLRLGAFHELLSFILSLDRLLLFLLRSCCFVPLACAFPSPAIGIPPWRATEEISADASCLSSGSEVLDPCVPSGAQPSLGAWSPNQMGKGRTRRSGPHRNLVDRFLSLDDGDFDHYLRRSSIVSADAIGEGRSLKIQ
jgi:hypothetical protein